MIGRLRGVLVDRGTESIVLDVGGIGYQVAVTPRTLVGLPGIGEEVVLHTHLHVREDQLALFGFDTVADKALFSMLLGVSGIGPKVGLAILATMTPEQLQIAVVSDDVTALTAVPGIGKRSAEKLMVELRPKMEVDFEAGTASGPLSEVREALVGLGYGPDEIRGTLADMPQDLTVADMVKRSLQRLGRATS